MVGITEEGIRKAFQARPVGKAGSTNTQHKHLVKLCKEYQLEQLSPGPKLDHLVRPALQLLMRRMNTQSILSQGAGWYANASCDELGSIHVDLYQWVSDALIDLGTRAYFGDLLQEIEPNTTRTFMAFEALSWQALYQYSRFLCGDMIRAKETLQNAMARYFASPKDQRTDMSWFISKIEEEMELLDVPAADRAIFFFQLYWR